MMKKVLFHLLLAFIVLTPISRAQNLDVNVYLFSRNGCPHCVAEKTFLKELLKKDTYQRVKIVEFEVMSDVRNAELFSKVGNYFNVAVGGVPFTVVGSKYVVGYLNDETSGKQIEAYINGVMSGLDKDVIYDLVKGSLKPKEQKLSPDIAAQLPTKLKLPLFGEVALKELSLPALTFVIALFDGLNPCAMWVLLFLISMLLGMGDRKKMWLLGGTFILASAFVYFLLLTAWLNIFLFVGFVFWIRIVVGLFALSAGVYSLAKVFKRNKAGCEITETEKKRKIFERIKEVIQKEQLALSLVGIALLAFAINIIEALCSAGLPAVWTKVLTMSKLPILNYYLYIVFYVFVFMLDDIIVFVFAMTTLKVFGIESKYAKYSHILGGIVMLVIGLLMVFRPELLSFS